MPFPRIPTDTYGFVEFIKGANAFYEGHDQPRGLFFNTESDGWRWAATMSRLLATVEARRATVH